MGHRVVVWVILYFFEHIGWYVVLRDAPDYTKYRNNFVVKIKNKVGFDRSETQPTHLPTVIFHNNFKAQYLLH
jgi:hypothetical protein